MIWALVIIVGVYGGTNPSVVPGFATLVLCEKAAAQVKAVYAHDWYRDVSLVCVQTGEPK